MTDPTDQGRQQKYSVGSPPGQSALAYMSEDPDGYHDPQPSTSPRGGPMSAPPSNGNHTLERPHFPTRASTVSSPHDLDHKKPKSLDHLHARSEDLNHAGSASNDDIYAAVERSLAKAQQLSASRPSTPAGSNNHILPSSSDFSHYIGRRPPSVASVGCVVSPDSSMSTDSVGRLVRLATDESLFDDSRHTPLGANVP